jgi:hypothetical protein
MLWGIVLSFIATGAVADSISLFNPDPGAPISAYSAGVGCPHSHPHPHPFCFAQVLNKRNNQSLRNR